MKRWKIERQKWIEKTANNPNNEPYYQGIQKRRLSKKISDRFYRPLMTVILIMEI